MEVCPLSNEGRNCYEDILASVTKYYSPNYINMFAGTWCFDFCDDFETIGVGLECKWQNLEDNLKYTGISMETLLEDDSLKAYETICKMLNQGNVVAFTIDMKVCHWHSLSKEGVSKIHVVIGCNIEKDGSIICADCKPVKSNILLTKDSFLRGYSKKILVFRRNHEYERLTLDHLLKEHVGNISKSENFVSSFNAMRNMSERMKYLNITQECSQADDAGFWLSPLMNKMNCFAIGRKQFGALLQYMSKSYSCRELYTLGQDILGYGQEFSKLRNILIKARILGISEPWGEKISKRISHMANDEEKTYYQLKNILQRCNEKLEKK